MKTRRMYKAERMSLNRISILPQPIIETILSLLSTKEAARTSVLSKEWRYKWTSIPELRFKLSNGTSEITSDITSAKKYMDMYDVYLVLLRRQGPIHEFSLVLDDYWEHYYYFEFEQIMHHLSRHHTVKDLYLNGLDGSEDKQNVWYELPLSVFALHHLTELYLCTFDIELPSIFNGFGSLVSLSLIYVKISTETLLQFLSNCPSLKKLSLNIDEAGDKCTINALLKCLPVIEDLTISGDASEWLVPDSGQQELPTSLIHLKSLCLNQMCLFGRFGSALLLVLIKCSPNLENAHLEMEYGLDFSAIEDKYSNVWLEHLNELSVCFCSSWLDTEFVKFILARSPNLKRVPIFTVVDRKHVSKMLLTLKRAPRKSPAAMFVPWGLYR